MKALTLYQPWATLVAVGAKRIETRSWSTNYRGPLAIHASKNKKFINRHNGDYICYKEPFHSVLLNFPQAWPFGVFPLGVIVAICELVTVKQIDQFDWEPHQKGWQVGNHFWEASDQEKAFGDYTPGRFAWFLSDIEILKRPIDIKGAMGLWNWEGYT